MMFGSEHDAEPERHHWAESKGVQAAKRDGAPVGCCNYGGTTSQEPGQLVERSLIWITGGKGACSHI